MPPTRKETIQRKALDVIGQREHRDGIRYSELMKTVAQQFPSYPRGTLHGAVWNLDVVHPQLVYKPARGIFRSMAFRPSDEVPEAAPAEPVPVAPGQVVREGDFYESFAEWITVELEECTKAVPLGGNRFRDKWGTPDVIGILEAGRRDIIKLPTEVVSAEIKADRGELITAFGQACSYLTFSHKAYLVVPRQATEEDIARLDVLCRIVGVGLVLFDNADPRVPDYRVRVRASRHDPDMFYKYIALVEKELFGQMSGT